MRGYRQGRNAARPRLRPILFPLSRGRPHMEDRPSERKRLFGRPAGVGALSAATPHRILNVAPRTPRPSLAGYPAHRHFVRGGAMRRYAAPDLGRRSLQSNISHFGALLWISVSRAAAERSLSCGWAICHRGRSRLNGPIMGRRRGRPAFPPCL